jgi:two-component system, cell cycle response regulator DivK
MNAPQMASLGLDHVPLTLLVDRDADTRRMYAEFLKSGGCEIAEAEDGREALAIAMTHHPDVVITETRLPGLSGFDLCGLLRRDAATSMIPIIFVTGDVLESDLRRAQRSGADAVLNKPCLPDRLLREVRRAVQQSIDLRARGAAARLSMARQIEHSNDLLERSQANVEHTRRIMLSRAHHRHDTTEPANPPPALICPNCDSPLQYLRSHIGGVSARHAEQWDYLECTAGCGTFQYRERTRKIRKV